MAEPNAVVCNAHFTRRENVRQQVQVHLHMKCYKQTLIGHSALIQVRWAERALVSSLTISIRRSNICIFIFSRFLRVLKPHSETVNQMFHSQIRKCCAIFV